MVVKGNAANVARVFRPEALALGTKNMDNRKAKGKGNNLRSEDLSYMR